MARLVYDPALWKQHKLRPERFRKTWTLIYQYFDLDFSDLELQLTDSKEIKKLNQKFRNRNRPTDVLSFELKVGRLFGTIVIDLETAAKQAKDFRHSLEQETIELFIHACLHLVGFDHENAADAELQKQYEIFFTAQV